MPAIDRSLSLIAAGGAEAGGHGARETPGEKRTSYDVVWIYCCSVHDDVVWPILTYAGVRVCA